MTRTLDQRSLNRATLERQSLLTRAAMTTPEALTRVGGLQAQTAQTWYVGLWSRVAGYRAEETSARLAAGDIVRMALMRSTLHLVTAADAGWLRPLVEPVIVRATAGAFGRDLAGVDRDELTATARAALAGGALTCSELGRALAIRWPGRDPQALGNAARAWLPLVQVPPRGLWRRSGKAAHLPLDQWPGTTGAESGTVDTLVRRYLAAFGPATVADCQQWSGLTRLAEVTDRLRPELVTFRDEQGRELFDLPDAPRPGPGVPAPVRFLYDFDNLLLSHADRTRVVDVDYTTHGFGGGNTEQPRSVLVDGFVAATWRVAAGREGATLTVRPFRRLSPRERDEITAEGAALLAFLNRGAHEVTIRD